MHEIKRASLERDFMHRPSADGVINIHTARHKSSTQHKHTPKRPPLLSSQAVKACAGLFHHQSTFSPATPRMQCRRRAFVRTIKPPSSSQPSEDTVPLPVQLHLQGFCFSPLKVDAYSLVFSFPVQLQEVYHLRFLPCTAGIRFHDM